MSLFSLQTCIVPLSIKEVKAECFGPSMSCCGSVYEIEMSCRLRTIFGFVLDRMECSHLTVVVSSFTGGG